MFQDLNPLDRSTAIMEIIILMLVAAIIGFVVAWLYYRSIYKKQISDLESELSDYRNNYVPKTELEASQAALLGMTDERNGFRVNLGNAESKLKASQSELAPLRAEIASLKASLGNAEAKLKTSDSALAPLRAEIATLTTSLGTADSSLTTSESELARLRAEITSLKASLDSRTTEVADLKGKLAQLAQLEERLNNAERQLQEVTASKNALTENLEKIEAANQTLTGDLDGAKAEGERLASALAACENRQVAVAATPEPSAPAEESKEAKLAAIRLKRDSINFARIGEASFENRDDLKIIKGVGPFIEEKLNALGIFTFAQISRFTDEDIEAVTKAIAFFPGRIERDNWVTQAADL